MGTTNMKTRWPQLLIVAALTVAIFQGVAGADRWNIENPSLYPGTWYRIEFDKESNKISGTGDGQGWYYYPESNVYRMWWRNGNYDPTREGYIDYLVYSEAIDPNWSTYLAVRAVWTTAEWSLSGHDSPPLPEDGLTVDDESAAMSTFTVLTVDNYVLGIGSAEAEKYHTIREYNPEWVGIEIQGRNVHVCRWAKHECRAQGGKPEGAWCDKQTGACYLGTEDDGKPSYVWLGAGTNCEDCAAAAGFSLDFGDAPDSYGTLAAGNGARHTVVRGVFLGSTADAESDGKPGPLADGDDLQGDDEDGVAFTSPLSPGGSANIEVTASAQGYLNAWIDFNQNGKFNDVGEQVFTDQLLARGVNKLTLRVPDSAVPGATFARFRYNTRGLLASNGPAADGEVEDYKVTIIEPFEPQSNSGKGGIKAGQPPQTFDTATPYIFNGWDELSGLHLRQIAADDWECKDAGPVTGFQWWGSFQGWKEPLLPAELPLAFHVALWTNAVDPGATDPAKAGHPDALVWETFSTHWAWNIAGYNTDPRRLNDDTCFQFTVLLSQDEWFHPALAQGSNGALTPATYWLSIAAVYDTHVPNPTHPWGWTTRPRSFGSGAAEILQVKPVDTKDASWPPTMGSRWQAGARVEHPKGTAWDLAFELLTNRASDSGPQPQGLAPVYRFWSEKLGGHFFTIDEAEKNLLIKEQSKVWTFEGIAFYAYPPAKAPVGSKPVYRFWSEKLGHYFYSISESEKQNLADKYSKTWHYEGISWYAFE